MPLWNDIWEWIHIIKIFYLQKLSLRSPEGELRPHRLARVQGLEVTKFEEASYGHKGLHVRTVVTQVLLQEHLLANQQRRWVESGLGAHVVVKISDISFRLSVAGWRHDHHPEMPLICQGKDLRTTLHINYQRQGEWGRSQQQVRNRRSWEEDKGVCVCVNMGWVRGVCVWDACVSIWGIYEMCVKSGWAWLWSVSECMCI